MRSENEAYAGAQEQLDTLVRWLESGEAVTHTELEDGIEERGVELMRRLHQGRLDRLTEQERQGSTAAAAGETKRERTRQVEGLFGRVTVRREGEKKEPSA